MTVDAVVNSAGLGAQKLARATEGYPARACRGSCSRKGNYFGFPGRPAFSQLIYPAPVEGGLGTHVTLDLAGRMRFGPDVEWIDAENYTVDPKRAESFYASVRTYLPALPDDSLVPDYCGIRPKLTGKGEPAADFLIDGPADHGLPRLVQLFGIESPGLTSSLSIAEEVVGQLYSRHRSSGTRSSASAWIAQRSSSGARRRGLAAAGSRRSVRLLRPLGLSRDSVARLLVRRRRVSAAFTLSPVATMSPGRSVGSFATSIGASPNASLPLQVQPATIFSR